MSIFTSILTGGSNNHETTAEAANAVATDLLNEGVVGAITNTSGVAPATGAFAVNAQGTPDMTVAVTAGVAYVTATPTGQNSQNFRVRSTAEEDVTIAANSSGSTKYDWIYIKIDPDDAANPAVNGDDVATLVVSRSTSAASDDGTPPTYGYAIAVVTVANAASSITNGNITDKRVVAGVDTDQIADASVTSEKLTPTVAFRAYDSGGTTLTDGSPVKINLATEDYDYGSDFASSTFTAPVAGVYHFSASLVSSAISTHVTANLRIYKNGSPAFYGGGSADATGYVFNVSGDLLLAATDTVELYFFQNSAGNETTTTGTDTTWMSGHLVGAI